MMLVLVILLVGACLFCLLLLKRQRAETEAVRKASKMKSVFIRALSREIRTSLKSVSSLAGMVSKDDLYLSKSEKKTISDQILYNTNLISTLLDEVAIFSENGANGHQLKDERFSPNRLCQHSIDANRVNLHEGVRLVFRNQVGDSLFVSADYHIVELVLNKLVYTACRFTKEGEVGVGYTYSEPQRILTLYVEDTGDGIPEERKRMLFNWFDDPDLEKDATEFDLSVAQRLAVKIGGIVREAEFPHGTRMDFTFPVR